MAPKPACVYFGLARLAIDENIEKSEVIGLMNFDIQSLLV